MYKLSAHSLVYIKLFLILITVTTSIFSNGNQAPGFLKKNTFLWMNAPL